VIQCISLGRWMDGCGDPVVYLGLRIYILVCRVAGIFFSCFWGSNVSLDGWWFWDAESCIGV